MEVEEEPVGARGITDEARVTTETTTVTGEIGAKGSAERETATARRRESVSGTPMSRARESEKGRETAPTPRRPSAGTIATGTETETGSERAASETGTGTGRGGIKTGPPTPPRPPPTPTTTTAHIRSSSRTAPRTVRCPRAAPARPPPSPPPLRLPPSPPPPPPPTPAAGRRLPAPTCRVTSAGGTRPSLPLT